MASRDWVFPEKEYTFTSEGSRTEKLVSQDEFVLEHVFGLTNTSTHALDCNQVTGYVAFPAAFTLVLLDPKTNDQKFIESPSVKYISSVCFSDDGRLVALGETGCKPYVSVWSLKDHKEVSRFVIDHSVGVKAVVFHPKSSFLVVLGTQDCNIGVWDYIRGRRLAFTKWQTAPVAMTIPKNGSSIIVCGHRKITLFNTDNIDSNNYETNVFEDRKAVLLGRQSEYTFVDITSGKGRHEREVYTVTACGFLCDIKLGDILIDKAIKVDDHAFCVRYGLGQVLVGCCEGVVKLCHPDTLDITAAVSLDQLLGPDAMPKVGAKLYLDTTAIAINDKDDIVTCIYADCSMHSWQFNAFGNTVECSALLPACGLKPGGQGYDPNVTDNMYKASLFRAFIGCCDKVSGSMMFDPTTLAERHRQNSRQGFMHLFKENRARYQHANAVRFSPDGRDVVCGNEDGEIKVYDAASGALRRVIEAHSSQVTCIELMYDDEYQLVCSGGRDRIIFVLNAKTDFSLVQVLCDHSAAITTLRLTHNGGLLTLVSAAADNVILVRRAIPGKTLKFTVIGEIAESRCNKSVNITSEYIVTGARNGNIKLFRADPVFSGKPTKTIKCTQKFNQGTHAFRAIDIDPSGSFIATTQNPGQITVYHLQTGQPIASLSSQSDVTAIKFTSDLKYMVSSTSNGCTLVWRLPERMTDFMRFKQEKIYQVEMSREISYETYVSCVRVCKETTVCEDNTGLTRCLSDSYSCTNPSHTSDLDITPSIESLSFLRTCPICPTCPTCHGEIDRRSLYSTESCLSCSTCTRSYTDTLGADPSTDSSYHMHSAPLRLYCGSDDKVFGKSVEEATCTKLGPFRFKTSDQPKPKQSPHAGAINFQPGQDPGAQDDVPALRSPTYITHKAVGNLESEGLDTSHAPGHEEAEKEVNPVTSTEPTLARQVSGDKTERCPMTAAAEASSGKEDDHISLETASACTGQSVSPGPLRADKCLAESHGPGTVLVNASENYSECGKYPAVRLGLLVRDALAPFYQLGCSTPQHGQPGAFLDQLRTVGARTAGQLTDADVRVNLNVDVDGSGADLRQAGSPRAEAKIFTCTSSPMSFRTACSTRTLNSREVSATPEDIVFHSPAISPRSDLLGSKNSSPPRLHRTSQEEEQLDHWLGGSRGRDNKDSPVSRSWMCKLSQMFSPSDGLTTPVVAQVAASERDREQLFLRELQRVCQNELSYRISRERTKKRVAAPKTPPNSLEPSLTTNISGAGKSVFSCGQDVGQEVGNRFVDRGVYQLSVEGGYVKATSREDSADVQDKLDYTVVGAGDQRFLDFDLAEEGEVYNYHSITRDETGKLRRVSKLPTGARASPNSLSSDNPWLTSTSPSEKRRVNPSQAPVEILPRHIQCSRCTRRLTSKSRSSNELISPHSPCKAEGSPLCHMITPGLSPMSASGEAVRARPSPQTGGPVTRPASADSSQSVQPVLSKSQDACCAALRQCLQLSNSQETFYKLTWDSEDRELVDTLSIILKTKPDQFAAILNLSASQMDILKKKIYEADLSEQQSLGKCSADRSSSTLCSTKAAVPAVLAEKTKMLIAQQNNSSVSKESSATDCHHHTAKEIINIVERMLTEQPPVANFHVGDKVEGVRQLGALLHMAQAGASGFWDDRLLFGPPGTVTDLDQRSNKQCRTPPIVSSLDLSCSGLQSEVQHSKMAVMRQKIDCQEQSADHEVWSLMSSKHSKAGMGEESSCFSGTESGEIWPSHGHGQPICAELYKSRLGKLMSCSGGDRGWDTPPDTKYPFTRSVSMEREGQGHRGQEAQGQAPAASVSPDMRRKGRSTLVEEELESGAGGAAVEGITSQSPVSTPEPDNAREGGATELSSRQSPAISQRKYATPIVALFREQDDYLKKLKEVREKFERSIQALSDQRRSRLAEEDTRYYHNK